MSKIFFALMAVLFTPWIHADEWSDHKAKFTQDQLDIQPYFDRIDEMKAPVLALGREIGKAECLGHLDNVIAASPINPFSHSFQGQPIHAVGCGDPNKPGIKNYFQTSNIKSQFGFQVAMVLQTFDPNGGDHTSLTSYLLDKDYKLLDEVQYRYHRGSPSPTVYRVNSQDAAGNSYNHYYYANFLYHNFVDRQVFHKNDGSIANATQLRFKSDDNPNRVMLMRQYTMATQTEHMWDSFHLLVPFAGFGGFYQYRGISIAQPIAYRAYTIKTIDGALVCEYGFNKLEGKAKGTWFPSEKVSMDCISEWLN